MAIRIIDNLAEMTETARGWLLGGTVGCIVIIGPVHAGHLSLIHAARVRNERCVVCILPSSWSIPTSGEQPMAITYTLYSLTQNLELLQLAGTDVVFMPCQVTSLCISKCLLKPDGETKFPVALSPKQVYNSPHRLAENGIIVDIQESLVSTVERKNKGGYRAQNPHFALVYRSHRISLGLYSFWLLDGQDHAWQGL